MVMEEQVKAAYQMHLNGFIMIKRYEIRGRSVGTLKSEQMDLRYERGYISVDFYNDGSYNTIVRPNSPGTVTFTGSENDQSYSSISNGVVTAVRTGPDGAYSMPTFQGPIAFIKAEFDSIVDASHVIITISKYGEL